MRMDSELRAMRIASEKARRGGADEAELQHSDSRKLFSESRSRNCTAKMSFEKT
jgi:hypothetical protein